MIRSILTYIYLGVVLVFGLPWLILWSVIVGNPETMYSLAMRVMSSGLNIAGVSVRTEGVANIPSGVCVFAANHVSNLDPMVFFPAVPRRFAVLIKKEIFGIPILATGMRMVKYVAVDRSDREAAAASLDESIRHLRGGLSFAIFPEGTRSADGRLGPLKKGAVLMAIQAAVPIVPVSIAGTHRLMRKHSSVIVPGEVTVHFGEPIATDGLSLEQRNELLAQVRAAIAANLPPDQKPTS
jgi:1-acyl-sn-glycerol-3-phosphate acyltransferase